MRTTDKPSRAAGESSDLTSAGHRRIVPDTGGSTMATATAEKAGLIGMTVREAGLELGLTTQGVRYHVEATGKLKLVENVLGVMLITPESVAALKAEREAAK